MATAFRCPACSASLEVKSSSGATVRCDYCNTTVIVPEMLRRGDFGREDEILTEIGVLLERGRKIEAIKRMREARGIGLKQAKEMVEALERGEAVALDAAVPVQARRSPGCAPALFILVLLVLGGGLFAWQALNGDNPSSVPLPSKSAGGSIAIEVLARGEGSGPGFFQDSRTLAIDNEGQIYVGDFDGGRIQQFAADGMSLGQWYAESEGIVGGLVAGPAGSLYLLEGGQINRYRRADGHFLGSLTDDLPPREAAFIRDIRFDEIAPSGDGGLVALGDRTLLRLDRDGQPALLVPELFDLLPADVKSASIQDLAVDGANHIFLIFTFEDAIYHFDADGVYVDRFGRKGDGPGEFISPSAVTVDGRGRLLVEDFGRVLIFEGDGTFKEALEVEGVAFSLQVQGDLLYRLDRNGNRLVRYELPE